MSDKDEAVVDSHVDVDIPNGTEGSAKEVAKGLVGADGTEAVVPVPKPQSMKATKKPDLPKEWMSTSSPLRQLRLSRTI